MFDPIDVVIIGLTNFGSVGNVGHMNTIKIEVAKVTIQLEAMEKVDQSFAM
jgi:hypothetical protein